MFKSIWYLLKILVLIGVGVYLASLKGSVRVTWDDYVLTVHTGIAALLSFLIILAVSFFTGVLHDLLSLPKEWKRSRSETRRGKGHQAVIRALAAASAGDYKNAYYLAHRAQKFLPASEAGLSLLLQAHAARGRGNEADSEAAFRELLNNADTAVLGIQGLIQKEIIEGDFARALKLARDSAALQPRNSHLLKPVYDLEIRNRLWSDALATLNKIATAKSIPLDDIKSDRSAIYIVLGDLAKSEGKFTQSFDAYKKAYHANPKSTPAAMRLALAERDFEKRNAALSIARKNWTATANPQMLPVLRKFAPIDKKDQRTSDYSWMESFLKLHPESQEALLALAQTAIDHGMWGEAKSALARAEKIRPSRDLYLLWAQVEEMTNKNPDVIRQWLDRSTKAPIGPRWICSRTHRIFDQWVAVVEPEGFFNTLEWRDTPHVQEFDQSQWLLKQTA